MKTAISLGFEGPDYSICSPCCGEGEKKETPTKTFYPEFSIKDKPGLIKSLKAGDEVTATVRLRVVRTEVRDVSAAKGRESEWNKSGSSAELEVLAITPDFAVAEDADAGESGANALDEYMKKKVTS